jgi:uracil-DNA glycosylase
MNTVSLITAFFRQQSQFDMPDYFFSPNIDLSSLIQKAQIKSTVPDSAATYLSIKKNSVNKPVLKPLTAAQLMNNTYTSTPRQSSPNRQKLAVFFHESKTCRNCSLCESRVNQVFGSGNADAHFMVIGKVPGAKEDADGMPFTGDCGALLTKMLAAIGIDRKKNAFLTDLVKCRTPLDREPKKSEIDACMSILTGQIDIIRPGTILILGRTAAQALLERTDSMETLRSQKHSLRSIPAFVTYHPDDILKNNALKRPAWEDLTKLKKHIEEAGIYDTATK